MSCSVSIYEGFLSFRAAAGLILGFESFTAQTPILSWIKIILARYLSFHLSVDLPLQSEKNIF